MTDAEFMEALKAARAKAPPGMGDFALREIVKAAIEASENWRVRFLGNLFGNDKVI